jgi:xanthine phosphoribosyltransferase
MVTFEEIKERIRHFEFPETFDLVVAIANGGIIPAALLNQKLGVSFEVVKLSLRDADQTPMYDAPRLLEPIRFDPRGKRILLVEDRVKTGATLNCAQAMLTGQGALVKTFAVNGPADYPLFNTDCFRFPWIL